MHRLIWVILCALPLTLTAAPTHLTEFFWDALATHHDTTPMDDLLGYRIYCGQESGKYTIERSLEASTTVEKITDVVKEDGHYYCALTGYNPKGEGEYSNEVSFFLQNEQATPPNVPGVPGGFGVR